MKQMPYAILLMGPTASGKTSLALELAQHFPIELVSVDSAQVFRDMNIGTAKPDAETLCSFPHHLIDLISPEERYSAARFCQDALTAMKEISARGKTPLLVGGTMLYFKALLEGLADLPQPCPETRALIDEQAKTRGWPAIHEELAAVDPETAGRIHPADAQRIQRALEIYRLTGQPMSAFLSLHMKKSCGYSFLTLGLLPSDRSVLHARIADRFDAMLAAGLESEVITLCAKYRLTGELPSMRCVGYRQVWEVLNGLAPRAELRARGIYATRQLAKRQITWLSNTLKPEVFDCLSPDLSAQIRQKVGRILA